MSQPVEPEEALAHLERLRDQHGPTLQHALDIAIRLLKREHLVQCVITTSENIGKLHDGGAPDGIKNAVVLELHVAVRALVDFERNPGGE